MKIKLLILLFSIYSFKVEAQRCALEVNSGVGYYSMADQKSLNETMLKSNPFNARITNNFPPYFYYKLGLIFKSVQEYRLAYLVHIIRRVPEFTTRIIQESINLINWSRRIHQD